MPHHDSLVGRVEGESRSAWESCRKLTSVIIGCILKPTCTKNSEPLASLVLSFSWLDDIRCFCPKVGRHPSCTQKSLKQHGHLPHARCIPEKFYLEFMAPTGGSWLQAWEVDMKFRWVENNEILAWPGITKLTHVNLNIGTVRFKKFKTLLAGSLMVKMRCVTTVQEWACYWKAQSLWVK